MAQNLSFVFCHFRVSSCIHPPLLIWTRHWSLISFEDWNVCNWLEVNTIKILMLLCIWKAFKLYWFCLPRAYTPLKQWLISITFHELIYFEVINILLYWCMIILYVKCQYLVLVNWFSWGRGEENKRSNNIRSLFALPTPTQLIS